MCQGNCAKVTSTRTVTMSLVVGAYKDIFLKVFSHLTTLIGLVFNFFFGVFLKVGLWLLSREPSKIVAIFLALTTQRCLIKGFKIFRVSVSTYSEWVSCTHACMHKHTIEPLNH